MSQKLGVGNKYEQHFSFVDASRIAHITEKRNIIKRLFLQPQKKTQKDER